MRYNLHVGIVVGQNRGIHRIHRIGQLVPVRVLYQSRQRGLQLERAAAEIDPRTCQN